MNRLFTFLLQEKKSVHTFSPVEDEASPIVPHCKCTAVTSMLIDQLLRDIIRELKFLIVNYYLKLSHQINLKR